jgi:uncharacterized membrane protein YgcG
MEVFSWIFALAFVMLPSSRSIMRSVKKVLLFVAAVCVMHSVQACTGGPDPEDPGLNPQPLPPGPENPAVPSQDGRDKNSDTTGAGGGSTSSGSSSSGGSSGGSSGLPMASPDGGDGGTDAGDN